MGFNWFDIVLILIMLWSALTGLRAGFARVVIGFVAAIAGLLAGFWCYRILAAKLMPWVQTVTAANILGFLLIFVGVLILGSIISAFISQFFNWIGLSSFNRLLGGLAGIARGAVVIAALVDVVVAYSPSPVPAFLQKSRVLPYTLQISSWVVTLAPRELKDIYTEQMDNLKQLWAPPRKGDQEVKVRATITPTDTL